MTPPDDNDPSEMGGAPRRLSELGSGFERQLLRSGGLDVASSSARQRAQTAAQNALEVAQGKSRRRRRNVQLGFAASVCVVLGGVWLRGASRAPAEARLQPEPVPKSLTVEPSAVPAVPLQPCPKLVISQGADPLIDDFEDGNARLAIRDGRSGVWTANGDGTGKQTPGPNQTAFPLALHKGAGAGRFALRVATERLTATGASLYVNLAPGRCYDASAYAGVEFSAQGPGRIYASFTMIDVMESKWGGLCEKDCYDEHAAPVDLSGEWRRYAVTWQELEQVGWGARLDFDPKRLLSLGFSARSPDTPIQFWIDDVAFIKGKALPK